MKTLFFLTSILFVSLTNSCSKFDVQKDEEFNNVWVEEINRLDTITFNINKKEGHLVLNRGVEIRNGYLLPKWGAGPYSYTISSYSISLISGYSECRCSEHYLFKPDHQKRSFIIGNFFAENSSDPEQLTFIKN